MVLHGIPVMSSHDISDITGSDMMSWVYPIKDWAIWGPGVHFGSKFDCLLGVLVHARIDTLTCPHFWSLLPSSVLDWVVVAASISDTMMPLSTPIRPMSVTSITLHAVFTGLSSFR